MKHGSLQLLGIILTSALLMAYIMPADVAPPPTDVAPPVGPIIVFSAGVLCVLGLLVVGIVIVSVLVIRSIRKKNLAPKEKDA